MFSFDPSSVSHKWEEETRVDQRTQSKLSFVFSHNMYDEEEYESNKMSESGFGSTKGNYWTESRLKKAIYQHDVDSFKDVWEKQSEYDRKRMTFLIHEAVYNRCDAIAKEILSSISYPSQKSNTIEKIAIQGIWTLVNRLGKTDRIVHCLRLGFSNRYLDLEDFLSGMRVVARRHHKEALSMYFQKSNDFNLEPERMDLVSPFVSFDLKAYRSLSEEVFREVVQMRGIYNTTTLARQIVSAIKANDRCTFASSEVLEARSCLRHIVKDQKRQRRGSKRYPAPKKYTTSIKDLDLAGPPQLLKDRVCVYKRPLLELDILNYQNYNSVCDENSVQKVIEKAKPCDVLDIMDRAFPADLLFPCHACLVVNKTSLQYYMDRKSFKSLLELWLVHSMDLQEVDSILLQGIQKDNIILVAALVCHYPEISYLCLHTCVQQRPQYVPLLSRLIANMFKRKHQNKFDYLNVYPSWVKRDKIILVVIYGYGGKAYTGLPSEYQHIKLVWRNVMKVKEEPYRGGVFLNKKNLPREDIDGSIVSQLFQNHSNLNYIVLSDYKCVRHRMVPKQCIALYCTYKRYVPLGEYEFPRKIHQMETDVREGICLLSNGTQCGMGDAIYTKPDSGGSGTLGGFVSKDEETYMLTCAHTIFPDSDLCHNISCSTKTRTVVKDNAEVGHPICASFSHGVEKETSIDASLIQISPQVRKTESLVYRGPMFNSKGLTENSSLKYENGLTTSFGNLKMNTTFIKIGAETGLTTCCPTANRSHIRINSFPLLLHQAFNDRLEHSDMYEAMDLDEAEFTPFSPSEHTLTCPKEYIMYNQIEIDFSQEAETFTKLGDSGSLVFIIDEKENLSCVGLMIGLTSNRTAIVTPIQPVLEQMNKILNKNGHPLKLIPFEIKIHHPLSGSTQIREDIYSHHSKTTSDQIPSTAESASASQSQNLDLLQQIGILLQQSEQRASRTSQQILQQVTEMKSDLNALNNKVGDLEVKHISTQLSLDRLSQDVKKIERQAKDS